MRYILLELALILTPLLIYRTYVRFVVARKADKGMDWNEGPVTWLLIAGLVLAILGFVLWGLIGDRSEKGAYTPATYEDGKLIPSKIDD